MVVFRYGKWDGTQEVFAPDHDQLLKELSNDLMNHGDVNRALRDLFQRGMKGEQGQRTMGLKEMLDRLKNQRQQQLKRYNLDSVMDELKKRLDDIVNTERQGIDRRLQEAQQSKDQSGQPLDNQDSPNSQPGSQQGQQGKPGSKPPNMEQLLKRLQQRAERAKEKLDGLPESVPGAVKELSDYEFMDPDAARKFKELQDMLRGQMMNSMFQNMRQSLQNMTPQDMARIREMLKSLNKMLQEKAQGREPNFQQFMQQFGDMFGQNPPQSLDELMQQMSQQMGAMQSLMDSMSPEQRDELEELLEQSLDPATRAELQKLSETMQQLFPSDQGREFRFGGDESLNLDQASSLMEQLQAMDNLEDQIKKIGKNGDIDSLNLHEIEELLGPEARRHAEQLQQLAKMLEEAGYAQRKGQKLELTAKGIRKIGERALQELFTELKKERLGRHQITKRGAGGDFTGETRPFVFGDQFDLALEKTVANAVLRTGIGTPVRLLPQDFEINEPESVTQTATCLLLDQSRSMGLFGSFQAAKKVTMALQALIQTHFPRDVLYIIGFSDYAIEIKPEDLPHLSWNAWVSGTNMHHALMLSRKLLNKHKGATRQVLMITDGEPTAHLEGTHAYFNYPPTYRTISETMKEVVKCTKEGITINTFMLENNYELIDFVGKLTRINKGRAFYSTPDALGQFVLVDYVKNRKKRISA